MTPQKMASLKIIPFRPKDQDSVRRLIEKGLSEHWGFLDSTKNPDLNDIAYTYCDDIFLVAWLEDQIIGTGALLRRSKQVGQIVRMSVANHVRRQGIGREILKVLVSGAKDLNYNEIILETTQSWQGAIHFYEDCGFRLTHYKNGNAFFSLPLD